MSLCKLFSVSLGLLLFSAPVWADQAALAVDPIESRGSGLKADELIGLSSLLAAKLGESGKVQIVPGSVVKKRLTATIPEGASPVSGPALDYRVRARIARLGKHCLWTGQLLDGAGRVILRGESVRCRCRPDAQIEGLEKISAGLSRELQVLSSRGNEHGRPGLLLAVSMIESRGSSLTVDELVSLSDFLASRLASSGKVRIYSREVTSALRREMAAVSGRTSKNKRPKKVAGQPRFWINTAVSRVGKICLLTSSVFDLEVNKQFKGATVRTDCNAPALVDSVEKLAAKLERALISVREGGLR